MLFVLTLLCTGLALYGQSTSGTITGVVTDQSKAVIPGAKVTITDIATGVSFSTQSSAEGFYTHARVPEGHYRLEVVKTGFKTLVLDDIQLNVDDVVRVDARLDVGSYSETVEVTSAPPLLQTETAEVKTELSTTQINELPVLGRNVANLQYLAPGAVNNGSTGIGENPQGAPDISVNGQPNGGRSMLLDGTDDNENVLGGNVIIPNQDSVGSVSVATSSWDAEYGRVGGAITQISTKSGTDKLHGTLFEFAQNRAFNAADPFSHINSPLVYNQFGGSFGGPIRKTKLYYFGDAELKRQRQSNTQIVNLPSSQMRGGDFSTFYGANGEVIPIFDPATGNPDGTGRTQFPGNVIPQNRLDPIAQKILALLPATPASNGNAYSNNYIASASTKFDPAQYTARVDDYLSDKTRMFARYIILRSNLSAPGVYGIAGGPSAGAGGVGGISTGNNQDLSANITHLFSSHLLFDARFGYSHYGITARQPDANTQLDDQVGLTGINNGSIDQGGLSIISIGGPGTLQMSGGATCNCPLDETMNYYQYVANLAWIAGSHTVKFGTDFRWYHNLRITNDAERGTFGFSPMNTGSYTVDSTGNLSGSGFASLLLDQVNNWSQAANMQKNIGNEYEWHVFNYAQDSWKLNPKLTVNYGVRYEIYTPPSTPKGAGSNFDPNSGMVEIAGVGSVSSRVNVTTRLLNLDPRFAAAYQARPGTVIRMGYARSYFPNVYNILISNNYPLIAAANYTPTLNYVTAFTLESPRPAAVFPTIPSSGTFMLPADQSITYNPTDRRNGHVDSFNLTLEQSVGQATTLSAAYVGSLGRNQYFNIPVNDPIPGPGQQLQNRPLYQKFGFTQNITNRTNEGHSNYHSLQVQANHRMSSGLTFLASLAWQKSIDYGTYDVQTNPYNIRGDKGVAGADRKLVFSLGHVYQIPIGRGQKYYSNMSLPLDLVFGGWQFSGITQLQSGPGFNIFDSSNATLNSNFNLRPDVIGNWHAAHPSRQQWYNPSGFTAPGLYREGTASRNLVRGPGFARADWSAAKHFKYEGYDLEFRTDAFNVLNRTNLNNPDNTFNSPTAGQISSTFDPMRVLQIGLHLQF